ncbi:MAG: sodium:proton antiporter [Deltaproteobacteria bacterium]|nr:sodium:proton antiporter [Deltaproteobacteria bacterium]
MQSIAIYWVTPFVLMLLGIAILPLALPHFWEKNLNKALVALGIALPTAVYLIAHDPHALLHTGLEYFSFISLLAALFVVSGGIALDGDLRATPTVNTAFLAIGAVLASIIGTTGASMLLIRALLHTNRERHHVKHIPIFFIFVVSNIGGLLTPIGDPPLFLGYLRGVPFFWTLKLFPIWLLLNGALLALFYLIDRIAYSKETKKDLTADRRHVEPLKLIGSINFLLLAGVVLCVFLPTPYREGVMLSLALLSLKVTPQRARQKNRFNFHPIVEVAVLFAGIFIAMVPALWLLEHHGAELGITHPAQFFWLAGSLSSFLDNAPTYLTFFSLAQGLHLPNASVVGITEPILLAISAGAVLMGAVTYIGNGPNFMVKAISDHAGIKTPSFFGYMLWSVGILIPLFGTVTWIFFL